MLEINEVTAGYNRAPVLNRVSLSANAGQLTALLGTNGAGKSTLVRVIAGFLPARNGQVLLDGHAIHDVPVHRRARTGLAVVTEEKHLFTNLSVADHLALGNRNAPPHERAEAIGRVHRLFPILAERPNAVAGSLSGGQQQMIAIGRALAGAPRCLVLDEPSLGVAPQIVADLLRTARELADSGLAVVLVEQNARMALRVADKAVVLQRGHVAFDGNAHELAEPNVLESFVLGAV